MTLSYQEMEKLLDKLVKDATRSRRADQSALDISEIKDILKDMADKTEKAENKENSNLEGIDKDLKDDIKAKKENDRDKKSDDNHDALMKLLGQHSTTKAGKKAPLDIAGSLLAFGAGLKKIVGEFDIVSNSYEKMVSNGSGWSGDMLNMGKTINKAGFGVEEFTKMMAEGGAAVKAVGGPEYLKFAQNTRELNIQMGRMGISQDDQIKMMSSYTEILKSSGDLTKVGTQEAADKFRNLVGSSERLAGAFGMTVQQFIDLRESFAKDKSVVLSTFGLNKVEAANVRDYAASLTSAFGRDNATIIANAVATMKTNHIMSTPAYELAAQNPEILRLINTLTGRISTDYTNVKDSDGKPMSGISSDEVEQSRKNVLSYAKTNYSTIMSNNGAGISHGMSATADLVFNAAKGEVGPSRDNPSNGNGTGTGQTDTTNRAQEDRDSRSKLNASRESILTASMDALNKTIGALLEIDKEANLQAAGQNYKIADTASVSLSKIDGNLSQILIDNKQNLVNELTMIKHLETIIGLMGIAGIGGLIRGLGKGATSRMESRRSRRGSSRTPPDDTPPSGGNKPNGDGPKSGGGGTPNREGEGVREQPANNNERLVNNTRNQNPSSVIDQMRQQAANDHPQSILEEHNQRVTVKPSSTLSKITDSKAFKAVFQSDTVKNYGNDIKDLAQDYKGSPIKTVANSVKGLGLLGTGIVVASAVPDYLDVSRQESAGEITHGKALDKKERIVGGAAGGVIGASVGADIGATVGSIVPVVGTVIGGVAGAYIGGKAGEYIGDHAGHIFHNNFNKKDTPPSPENSTSSPSNVQTNTDSSTIPAPSSSTNTSSTNTNSVPNDSQKKTNVDQKEVTPPSIVRLNKEGDSKIENVSMINNYQTMPQPLLGTTWTSGTNNVDLSTPPSTKNNNDDSQPVNTANSSAPNPATDNSQSAGLSDGQIISNLDNNPAEILKSIKASFDQFFDNSNEMSSMMIGVLNQINTNGSQANSILRNNNQYIG